MARWLQSIDMAQYTQEFVSKGYDSLRTCALLEFDDFQHLKVQPAHHQVLLYAARELQRKGPQLPATRAQLDHALSAISWPSNWSSTLRLPLRTMCSTHLCKSSLARSKRVPSRRKSGKRPRRYVAKPPMPSDAPKRTNCALSVASSSSNR